MAFLFSLPRIVKVLVFVAGLQFYLAQSLVMVEHCNSCGRGTIAATTTTTTTTIQTHRQRSSTLRPRAWGPSKSIHRKCTAPPLIRQTKAACADSTTAMFFASTDANNEDGSLSSSSAAAAVEKSLNEILNELTDRGVAFSPLASKAELAELLEQETDFEGDSKSTNPDPEKRRTERPTTIAQEEQPRPPTTTLSESDRNNEPPEDDQIQDRIQRRANRTRRSTQKGMEDSPRPSSPNPRRRRQRRREGEFRDDSLDDYNYIDSEYDVRGSGGDIGESRRSDGTRLRNRLRRQRRDQSPPSLLDSISSPVSDMVGIGARASRIARRKTGKLWQDLVESTYDDYDYGDAYDTGVRQNPSRSGRADRRERRRSGFNWQQSPRSMGNDSTQRRRNRRPGSSRIDDGGNVPAEAAADVADVEDEIPPVDYYSSDKNQVADRGEILRKQKREQRRKARQARQQQQPREDEKPRTQTSSSARSRMGWFAKRTSDSLRSRIRKKMPIGQILEALDERNILYSPKASRIELEDLLLDGLGDNDVVAVKKAKEDIEVIEVESISPEDWKRQQEEKLQQKQKEQVQNEEQKQKQKKNSIDTSVKSPKGSTTTSSVHTSYRSSGVSATTAKAYGSGFTARQRQKRQERPEKTQTTKTAAAATSSSPSQQRTQSFENPSDSSTPRTAATEDGAASRPEPNRRIYSPYGRRKPESAGTESRSTRSARRNKRKESNDFVELEDDFDRFSDAVEDDLWRFGDFLGDSVDTIFWGSADEESSSVPEGRESFDRRDPNSPHWKDRAEERLDRMMGIHKAGGKTYNRWSQKETLEDEEDRARDYDAVSYTKGRTRPRGRKRRSSRRAFWEEDKSVLSTLLGHNWDDSRPPQRSLQSNLEDIRGALRSSNNLTTLLRNLLTVSTRIVGSLSRWASVRDTIPRPVVLLGAVGSGFVSRPGNRIKNTVLAFLSIRVLGEWLSEPDRRSRRRRPGSGHSSLDEEEADDEDFDCEAIE